MHGYQYEVLDIRNPALFYTLSEEIYEARLLNFSSAWYVNNFWPTVPGLSQQDTSVNASARRKWIFLNKLTRGEASQVRYSSFSSTIIRPSFLCKLSRFLCTIPRQKPRGESKSLPQQATWMASLVSHPVCVSTTILHRPQILYDELPIYGSTTQELDLQ